MVDSDFIMLGPEAKVKVNGEAFAVISGNFRDMGDDVEVSDSESGTFKQQRAGMQQLEATVECQQEVGKHHFAPPLNLTPDAKVQFELFPFGLTEEGYYVERFRILGSDGNWAVQGSRPQIIRFSGKSDGAYTRPNQP